VAVFLPAFGVGGLEKLAGKNDVSRVAAAGVVIIGDAKDEITLRIVHQPGLEPAQGVSIIEADEVGFGIDLFAEAAGEIAVIIPSAKVRVGHSGDLAQVVAGILNLVGGVIGEIGEDTGRVVMQVAVVRAGAVHLDNLIGTPVGIKLELADLGFLVGANDDPGVGTVVVSEGERAKQRAGVAARGGGAGELTGGEGAVDTGGDFPEAGGRIVFAEGAKFGPAGLGEGGAGAEIRQGF